MFGIDPTGKPHRVLWEDENIPFNGIPFLRLGSRVLECQHGIDRNKAAKRKYKESRKVSIKVI